MVGLAVSANDETALPPTAEHRGWSRKMILWSVALAAFLLTAAWGAANWKAFHLAYCKHLISSSDPEKQYRGMELIEKRHLRKGMTVDEVRKVMAPLQLRKNAADGDLQSYTVEVIFQFDFDEHGRLTDWELARDM